MKYNWTILDIDITNEDIKECLVENNRYFTWMEDNYTWHDFAYTYGRQIGLSHDESIRFADIIVYFYDERFDPEEEQELYDQLDYEFQTIYDEYEESEKMIRFFYHIVDLFKEDE